MTTLKLPHEIKRDQRVAKVKKAMKLVAEYIGLSFIVALGAYTMLGAGGLL